MASRPALPALFVASLLWAGAAAAQITSTDAASQAASATQQHLDVNVYPAFGSESGPYDLNVAGSQKGPPGTLAVTSAAPAQAYSFADILRNTHGYVSAGISSGGGHEFSGGVSIPIVPGKADLDLQAGTGQVAGFKTYASNGKTPILTYDEYSAGLHLHPADDLDAYIGISGLRLHGPNVSPYAYAFP